MPTPLQVGENIFSPLMRGEIGRFRRVGHSATNYFQSIDRTSFGFSSPHGGTASNVGKGVATTGGQVLNMAGNVGGVLGGVAGVATIAGAAVASGAFLAACAGPQVAITAGVVGLALLVKGTYSNREAAHRALLDYVWNLVDEKPPLSLNSPEHMEKAADAASTLLDDGKSQIKLIHSKLSAASSGLDSFRLKLKGDLDDIALQETKVMRLQRLRATTHADEKKTLDKKVTAVTTAWAKAQEPGGAIFEYVRRLSHTSNYLQAPHILALSMRVSHTPFENATALNATDYFAGTVLRKSAKEVFEALAAADQRIGELNL